MGFGEAVKTCFIKYVTFSGRARRSEYWFWTLFITLVSIGTAIIDGALLASAGVGFLNPVWTIAIFFPNLAVAVRRLHDIDMCGWWVLIIFVPLIGVLLLLYWMIKRGTAGENRFGPDPLAGEGVEAPAAA